MTATSTISTANPQAVVELDGKDLPAHCPNPLMPIWSSHPRVFLDMTKTGRAKCPYCGTEYCMKPGAVIKAH
ncbi:zinc-finger domain-containing protein [Glaciimonas sp. GG7]